MNTSTSITSRIGMTVPRDTIDLAEGRHLFGKDPLRYSRGRPDYPEQVFEILEQRCGLGTESRVLEIGSGSGNATRRLLRSAPSSLVALEPDERFAPALRDLDAASGIDIELRFEVFETARLGRGVFDLVFAATSFHWIPQQLGLSKAAECLRPGGWLALFWNVFGDPAREDPFHEATKSLLASLGQSPSQADAAIPFALDRRARIADLQKQAAFSEISTDRIDWTLELDPEAVRLLYGTFSNITRLGDDEREELLDRLSAIARFDFGGRVYRNMVTPIYTARRTQGKATTVTTRQTEP